ncbi:MAG: universal stress protein [Candidatus Dormibacteria bacterium]
MFTTILVASDGSDTADQLVAVAQSLAMQDRSKVVVAHVNELMVMRGGAQPVHLDRECHADLIVAGASRHGPLADFVFGTALRMLRLAPCPVLVVPAFRNEAQTATLLGARSPTVP